MATFSPFLHGIEMSLGIVGSGLVVRRDARAGDLVMGCEDEVGDYHRGSQNHDENQSPLIGGEKEDGQGAESQWRGKQYTHGAEDEEKREKRGR